MASEMEFIKGVCIVLDKESLIANNKDLLDKHFYRMESVEYGSHCAPNDIIIEGKYAGVSDFVQHNYRELFFKKHSDWAYEDEERLLIESPLEYLNIKGAIKYIALGGRLKGDKDNLRQIIEKMITPETMSYHYFNIHSFVEMSPTVNGYLALGASSNMLMLIQELLQTTPLAKDYLEWERRKLNGCIISCQTLSWKTKYSSPETSTGNVTVSINCSLSMVRSSLNQP